MGASTIRSARGGNRQPQLPAFCRTRRPVVVVSSASIRSLHALQVLGLLVQLSTLLLVITGTKPSPLAPVSTSTAVCPEAGMDAAGIAPIIPLSNP